MVLRWLNFVTIIMMITFGMGNGKILWKPHLDVDNFQWLPFLSLTAYCLTQYSSMLLSHFQGLDSRVYLSSCSQELGLKTSLPRSQSQDRCAKVSVSRPRWHWWQGLSLNLKTFAPRFRSWSQHLCAKVSVSRPWCQVLSLHLKSS